MKQQHDYTIRVYAILVDTNNEILLMEETHRGLNFTKFPGGGLEWGEGLLDCVKRELREELGLTNVDLVQFYTTDFFVESYFDTSTQVISIYYKTKTPIQKADIKFTGHDPHLLGIKWLPLATFSPEDVTFPIDKVVAGMLANS